MGKSIPEGITGVSPLSPAHSHLDEPSGRWLCAAAQKSQAVLQAPSNAGDSLYTAIHLLIQSPAFLECRATSVLRGYSLLRFPHDAPQLAIDPGLVALSGGLEPGDDIGIQTQRDWLLAWPVPLFRLVTAGL